MARMRPADARGSSRLRRRTPPPRTPHASVSRPQRYRGATVRTTRHVHGRLAVDVRSFARRDAAGPPLEFEFVLVHGLGVSGRYFRPLAAELSRHGAVHVVDLPGHGSSPDPRRRVRIDDHARALAATIDALGLDRPVLVGHSMGAQVVTRLAIDQPGAAGPLVLADPTMPPGRRRFGRAASLLLLDALREPPSVVATAIIDYARCGPVHLLRQSAEMLRDRMEQRMPSVAQRVLVVCGDRDPITSERWGRELASAAPRGSFASLAGTHVAMATRPALVADRILAHALGGLPAAAAEHDPGAPSGEAGAAA
jgi:pimeloyl-ACP methyl ester carboxylesterase